MDNLDSFSQRLKKHRRVNGLTQADVCNELKTLYGVDVSQTTLSRFESNELSYTNMLKLWEPLKKWLYDTESAVDLCTQHPSATSDEELPTASVAGENTSLTYFTNAPKRRRRTNLALYRNKLESYFNADPHPTDELINKIAASIGLEICVTFLSCSSSVVQQSPSKAPKRSGKAV
ncbi:unnamed protein product [Gongylonema pulchrum]|uniref:POU-specific domain-containing protein n=1 Tax=Gongylonema pulchrum TaxID=637853 RepID=A0A183CWY5_9BILA|nr:unnamed protein product [Gongylonema pulchrum]